ncbi:hypothetical protein BG015_002862 [Linnemannia schmuckeri]|uniref:MD-2-related lipid-recognition domain-containing protein n=1 Tax=Linnemannia schmuckeri TaxID=64567 RepID=A0A9P5S9I2_9FUNG|nr:hypothetical protein BG015_002862 [Linnemannia schmuckeri]
MVASYPWTCLNIGRDSIFSIPKVEVSVQGNRDAGSVTLTSRNLKSFTSKPGTSIVAAFGSGNDTASACSIPCGLCHRDRGAAANYHILNKCKHKYGHELELKQKYRLRREHKHNLKHRHKNQHHHHHRHHHHHVSSASSNIAEVVTLRNNSLDLERLAAAVRGCRFTTLVVNGGKSRPQLRDRAASSDAIPATLFDPLIQLFDFKPLTHIYLVNMPDCLQKFSVDFPGDLSHLEVLQVHLDIFNWEYLHGRTVYRLVSRLSHVTLLIVECPLEGYRAYLMNIWYALKAPSTALISTTSITPPSQDIEVQLFSRGKIHAKAVFRRQGAVPKSLMVDLNFDLRCEVIWQYILNSTIAHNIHTFHLDRAPSNGWFPIVLNWLENRQHQAISSSSSTVSTSDTNSTAPAAASSRININNATTTFVHLREISLCCFRLRADSERYLIELIKIATSPTLGLRCLRLVGLRLPLKSSHGINLGNQDGNSLTWSRLFIRSALWNLEEFEIRDSDFGDKHVEGFLLFMENTKTMEENERTKRRDREEEQEKRKGQLELGLITLEDGEMEEVADDSDIAQVPFSNCATGPTQFNLNSFGMVPYPLCINKNMCLTGTGALTTPVIEGAQFAITGKYLGRVVYTDNHDLCILLAASGFPCPVPVNVPSLTACVLVKPNCPANIGMAMTFAATNGDGGILYCQTGPLTAINCPP